MQSLLNLNQDIADLWAHIRVGSRGMLVSPSVPTAPLRFPDLSDNSNTVRSMEQTNGIHTGIKLSRV